MLHLVIYRLSEMTKKNLKEAKALAVSAELEMMARTSWYGTEPEWDKQEVEAAAAAEK